MFNAQLECVEVGTPEAQDKPEKPKGGSLAISAARICQEPAFHAFVSDRLRAEGGLVHPEAGCTALDAICKNAIYKWCGIESRAELDHNKDAAAKFRQLMREYAEFSENHVRYGLVGHSNA